MTVIHLNYLILLENSGGSRKKYLGEGLQAPHHLGGNNG